MRNIFLFLSIFESDVEDLNNVKPHGIFHILISYEVGWGWGGEWGVCGGGGGGVCVCVCVCVPYFLLTSGKVSGFGDVLELL